MPVPLILLLIIFGGLVAASLPLAIGGTAILGSFTVLRLLTLFTTTVRVLLVPATMRLLGRANWWAPGPLRRLYARYGIAETDKPAPVPAATPVTGLSEAPAQMQ